MPGTALITGITGQDGAYLAAHLLDCGYKVFGTHRRTSSTNFWRLRELGIESHPDLSLVEHDVTDPGSSIRLIERTEPDEVYNLAAQSFVAVSFDQPITTAQINALGALHLLEAIRSVNPRTRFYQASSSELFGKVQEVPQSETTPFHPRSPYAVSKLFAHWATVNYRESYGLFAASGILFNHESPLRGEEFVTRKITQGLARIRLGQQECLELGNLDAKRDWGFAGEFVEGMRLMLSVAEPDSYVLATGRSETVRDFVLLASEALGMSLEFRGSGLQEVGIDTATGNRVVRVAEKFYRPAEVDLLIGDAAKAKRALGWEARMPLEELARMMVTRDLERCQGASR